MTDRTSRTLALSPSDGAGAEPPPAPVRRARPRGGLDAAPRACRAAAFGSATRNTAPWCCSRAAAPLRGRSQPLGVTVSWSEFPSGPPLLEALNAGAMDFGSAGEAPPIFAQAAERGAALRRHRAAGAAGRGDPRAQGQPGAQRRGPARQDHRAQQGLERPFPAGARPGAGGRALRCGEARLPGAGRCQRRLRARLRRRLGDLGPVSQPPPSASTGARVLADGQGSTGPGSPRTASSTCPGAASPRRARRSSRPCCGRSGRSMPGPRAMPTPWRRNSPPRWASPRRSSASRWGGCPTASRPSTPTAVADQQRVADAFHGLGLLPKPIRVADAVWTQPERRAESQAERNR